MTLQSSGAISLADVQAEFGGSNPIGINEYYAAAGGVPGSRSISLNDLYVKSAGFAFTANVFGYNDTYSQIFTSSTYDGNIVTPGSGNSPKTFFITTTPYTGGTSNMTYYQGGSLNTTWSSSNGSGINVNHTFTFGSSSMQFKSYNLDSDSFENTNSSTYVFWTTDQGAPSSMFLYYHIMNFGGGGYLD